MRVREQVYDAAVLAVTWETSDGRKADIDAARPDRVTGTVECVIAALIAFGLYGGTCAHDVQWGDPAKLALYVWRFNWSLDQDVHLGALAWAWPFSRLPIEPFAFRLSLASVAASALTAGFIHALLLKASRNPWAARTGTASMMVSHTFWFVSTIPESYPVAILSMTVAAWLIVDRKRPAAAAVALSLGAMANALTLVGIPAAVWWVSRREARPGDLRRFLAGLSVGLGVPLVVASAMSPLVLRSTGAEWLRVFRSYLSWQSPMTNVPFLAACLVFNFAGPALFLMALGVKRARGEQRTACLLLAGVTYGLALFYLPQRSYLIPLPSYVAMAWLVTLGADDIMRGRHRVVSVGAFCLVAAAPPVVYVAAARVFEGRLPAVVRRVPLRDEARFYLLPWKNREDSARRYIGALGRAIPDDSAIFADFTILMPLLYAHRVEAWKPALQWEMVDGQSVSGVVAAITRRLQEGRRVFLLDDKPYYFVGDVSQHWMLVPGAVKSLAEVKPR